MFSALIVGRVVSLAYLWDLWSVCSILFLLLISSILALRGIDIFSIKKSPFSTGFLGSASGLLIFCAEVLS